MRGKRAKAERREDPSRPNPGRKGGGSGKIRPAAELPQKARATGKTKAITMKDQGMTNG